MKRSLAVAAEKEMPDVERSHLLRALEMPGPALFELGPALIWDFEE